MNYYSKVRFIRTILSSIILSSMFTAVSCNGDASVDEDGDTSNVIEGEFGFEGSDADSSASDEAMMFAQTYLENMTPRDKVGQLLMVGFYTDKGHRAVGTSEEETARKRLSGVRELIVDYKIGGVILFAGQNFSNKASPPSPYETLPEFIAAQTRSLQSFTAELDNPVPLLISIDQEGGGVPLNRVRRGVAELSSPMSLGAAYAGGYSDCAKEVGEINGRWMKAMGINIILGPLLDLASSPEYGGMETRPFCGYRDMAFELGASYVSGVASGSDGQVICCVKHFPGHGSTSHNADYNIYTSNDTIGELRDSRLYPFVKIADVDGDGCPGAMMPCQMSLEFSSSPGLPVTIDKPAMDTIFDANPELARWKRDGGLFITDDFGIRGIKNWMKEKQYPWTPSSLSKRLIIPSILAGNDVILLCSMEGNGYGHTQMIKGILLELEKRYVEGEGNPDDPFCRAVDARCISVLATKARMYPNFDASNLTPSFDKRKEIIETEISSKDIGDRETIDNIADEALTAIKQDDTIISGINSEDRIAVVSPRKWELKEAGSLKSIFVEDCSAEIIEYTYAQAKSGSIPDDADWIVIVAATVYTNDRSSLRSLIGDISSSLPDAKLVVVDGGYPIGTSEYIDSTGIYLVTFGHTRAAFAGAARWLCAPELKPPPGKSPIPQIWE